MFRVTVAARVRLLTGIFASLAAVAVQGQAVIRGTVRDSATQQPIAQAQLAVIGSGRSVVTDSAGNYSIALTPMSGATIAVLRLGFVPRTVAVGKVGADTMQLDVALTRMAQSLPAVDVEARAKLVPPEYQSTTRYDKFFKDRAANAGSGSFYTRKQLVAYGTLAHALRSIGVNIGEGRAGAITSLSFPACNRGIALDVSWQPTLIVDGKQQPINMLYGMSLSDVELIEIFPSSASSPADARGDGCGAVIIFTRQAS
jgi:hypothetical protein